MFGLSSAIIQYNGLWARLSGRADYLAVIFGPQDAWGMVADARAYGRNFFETYNDWSRALQRENVSDENRSSAIRFVGVVNENMEEVAGKTYDDMVKRQQGCCRSSKNLSLVRQYVDYLSAHERYSFSATALKFGAQFFAPHEDNIPTKESFVPTPEMVRYTAKFISRGSKAALAMMLEPENNGKIHFLLDGLDVQRVILKSGAPSTTASELRYLYRNRERLNGKVHFYRNHQKVSAPWESNPGQWRLYKPRRYRS